MTELPAARRRPVSARAVALECLLAVEGKGSYLNQALSQTLRAYALERRDRDLATELCYGVERRRLTLDWAVDLYLARGRRLSLPVRTLLRLGAYQLLFLDRVPPYAAVDETVALTRRKAGEGAAKLVNAVLRRLAADRTDLPWPDEATDTVRALSVRYSHPQWLVERWLSRFGYDEAVALMTANNGEAPLGIRVNRLRSTPPAVQALLASAGVTAEPSELCDDFLLVQGGSDPGQLPGFRDGLFTPQDVASGLVAKAVAPVPGAHVVDACAGAGTKSCHLAELMAGEGQVTACDLYDHKLRLVALAAQRLGIDTIRTVLCDARRLSEGVGEVDAVLVDAPCTGLGTIRRRPDLRWRRQPEDIHELSRLQKEILAGAALAVRPGGVLVYSTCTTEPEENEQVVSWFLHEWPSFRLEELRHYWPERAALAQVVPGVAHFWPHKHGTDGFFVARMRRV